MLKKSNKLKVYLTCPNDFVEQVKKAIWDAWGAKMWNYSYCFFVSDWKWYFTPEKWAHPNIWELWKAEIVDEKMIEFMCESDVIEQVVKEIKRVHPYEEIGIDIQELLEI